MQKENIIALLKILRISMEMWLSHLSMCLQWSLNESQLLVVFYPAKNEAQIELSIYFYWYF